MNRFESEAYSLNTNRDRDEDGYPSIQCQYCNGETATLEIAAWDSTMKVCADCAVCEPEPECECQMDGDLFNPALCEVHNSSSPWNARRRAVERIQMLEEAGCTPEESLAWRKMTPERAIAELKEREVA